MLMADGGNLLLLGGRDGEVTTTHLEVARAGEQLYQVIADVTLHVAGHVVVEAGHAALHHGMHGWPVGHTRCAARLRMTRVDGHVADRCRVGMTSCQPTQAVVVQGAVVKEAHQIVGRFLAQHVSIGLQGRYGSRLSLVLIHGAVGWLSLSLRVQR